MMRGRFLAGLCALLFLAAASSPVYGQGGTSSTISGTVVDTGGGVVPGAEVTVRHTATGVARSVITNAQGAFSFPGLNVGTYTVTVALDGFKTFVAENVVITSTAGADVRARLEVGGLTETVTVASSSEIIQTQSTTVSSTINANQITKLPLTTRSAMDFVNFLPGVSTPAGNRQASINGLPRGVINITLDGINIQDNTLRSTDGFFAIVSPRLDAIEEVSVTTAGQGADAGQGAVQIKFVTRSGTNQYTGSAYHYFRNDRLNANTWFNNRNDVEKATLTQHQTGARFGGPLVIPGLLNRGKAFFFGNYEEFRQPSQITRNRNLLTPAAVAGNYIYGNGATVNVLAMGAGNASTAASSTPDPTMSALLADIRAAAGTTGSISSLDANVDQLRYNLDHTSLRRYPTGRVDFNVTDRHRLSSAVNYNYFTDTPDTLNSRDATWPGFPVTAGQQSIRLSVSNTFRSTLTNNLVNEARVGYSGAPVKFFDEMNVGMYTGSLANQNGRHLVFPSVGSGLTNAGAVPAPQSRNATDLTLENTLTWLRGNHNVTTGVQWSRFDIWLKNSSLVPQVSFGLLPTDPAQNVITAASMAALTGVTPSTAELTAARNLYSLLTGRVTQISGDARINEATDEYEYMGVGTQRARMHDMGFFLQDSWRWRPNLTVNAGVRWTVQLPFTAQNNAYSTTTLEDVCGKSGVNPGGFCNLFQPGVMPGKQTPEYYNLDKGAYAYNTDWNNIAPNVGMAWTPARRGGLLGVLMSDEFVIRGGWARAYSREGMNTFTGQYNANPGVVTSATRNNGLGNILPPGQSAPLLLRNEALLGPPDFPRTQVYPMTNVITGSIRLFDPDIQIPYADSWTAGVQRQLTRNMALEVRYVGTLSDNAWQARNFNETNIIETGFLDEFRVAQANLQANIAAGRGNTFAFTGAPGTAPLPIMVAYLSARDSSQAANPAAYTGNLWTNATLLNNLAMRNPNPHAMAASFMSDATRRNNGLTAGMPANFFLTNPDQIGGAFITRNEGKTRHHSMQVELRRRLAQGLQFQSSYVLGRTLESVFYSHRRAPIMQRDTGSPGDLTHQLKGNFTYDLPFGRGRRFASNAGGVTERLVGGWQVGLNTRIQSGVLLNAGNVRLVGWTMDDVQKAFRLRFENDAKQVFMWPEDVVENTIRAFAVSPTSPTGYAGAAPTGRYFAPANGPDCIEVVSGWGDCPGTTGNLILTGPRFHQSDLRIAKQTQIVGRVNFEISAEALNVFNNVNFSPNAQAASSTLSNYFVTGLLGTNTSRLIQIVSRVNW